MTKRLIESFKKGVSVNTNTLIIRFYSHKHTR